MREGPLVEVSSVDRTFPAHPSVLRDVRSFIRERAHEVSFWPEVIEDLVLAVSEACANSVRHSRSTAIEVSWRRRADGAEVRIVDGGVYRPPAAERLGPALGYGLSLMRALVDEVDIEAGTDARPGTRVTLVMRRRPVRPSPARV